MTDTIPAEWSAPLPPAPEPQHVAPKQQKRLGLILALVAAVLALVAVSVFAFVDHGHLTDSRAHAATVSSQLADTKKDLGQAKDDNTDLTKQNQNLTATAKKCSVYPAIVNHLSKTVQYNLKALQGGMFGSIIWLPKATTEIHKVTHLLDSHQSYDGELAEVCGPSAVSGT